MSGDRSAVSVSHTFRGRTKSEMQTRALQRREVWQQRRGRRVVRRMHHGCRSAVSRRAHARTHCDCHRYYFTTTIGATVTLND